MPRSGSGWMARVQLCNLMTLDFNQYKITIVRDHLAVQYRVHGFLNWASLSWNTGYRLQEHSMMKGWLYMSRSKSKKHVLDIYHHLLTTPRQILLKAVEMIFVGLKCFRAKRAKILRLLFVLNWIFHIFLYCKTIWPPLRTRVGEINQNIYEI